MFLIVCNFSPLNFCLWTCKSISLKSKISLFSPLTWTETASAGIDNVRRRNYFLDKIATQELQDSLSNKIYFFKGWGIQLLVKRRGGGVEINRIL